MLDKTMEKQVAGFMQIRLNEGASLSDVQKMVNEEFKLKLTYMDIRILASTLDIDWKARDPKTPAKKEESAASDQEAAAVPEEAAAPVDGVPADGGDAAAPAAGKTVVEVSKLARPGMAISGSVTFASGSSADWYVDQTGRLGIENLRGAEPTREDVIGFQEELERMFRR